MMKPRSLAACLTAMALAIQAGCESTITGPVASPTVDAASVDARIYVSGAD